MKIKTSSILIIITCIAHVSCVVSKRYPELYYKNYEPLLNNLHTIYSAAYITKPLAIAYTDWQYDNVSIELKTDTVKYIYNFNIQDPALYDTLTTYGYSAQVTKVLLQIMKSVRCTWINSIEYNVDGTANNLISIAVHAKSGLLNFKSKYYVFHYYQQAQYYNEAGKLLNKKKLKQLRKVNNEIFYRITDKVCYTISNKFR